MSDENERRLTDEEQSQTAEQTARDRLSDSESRLSLSRVRFRE